MSPKGFALQVIDPDSRSRPSAIDMNAFYQELSQAIEGEVRFDRLSRAIYSTDAGVYQIVPAGVVLPESESDVVNVVRACARFERTHHSARRRDIAGGPVDRLGRDSRYIQVFPSNPRDRPGCEDGPRSPWLRPG